MILVAILTVQRDLVHDYRAYERRAAAIMADHGAKSWYEKPPRVPSPSESRAAKERHQERLRGRDVTGAATQDPRLAAGRRPRGLLVQALSRRQQNARLSSLSV
jgi:hypothetical protein